MPPALIILHKLGMLGIDLLALGAAHDIRVEHATLDRKPAFRQILPGMTLGNGRPVNIELAETRSEGRKHIYTLTLHGPLRGPRHRRLPQPSDKARDAGGPSTVV